MRMIALSGILAGAIGVFATPSQAIVITFDDLSADPIANGYQGLSWSNFSVANTTTYPPSGYVNGTVSPSNVAFNRDGGAAAVSNGLFTVNSFYLTAAWNDGLKVTVIGKNGGVELDRAVFTIDTSGPRLEMLNWSGITELDFSSSGGVPHGYRGMGLHFVLDNLSIAPDIPAPASLALLATGLASFSLVRRRKALAAGALESHPAAQLRPMPRM